MSNIERDERVAARAIEGLYGMSKALKGGGHDDVVTVEAVIEDLASQLRGAVEALRLIAEHARLDHVERGIAEADRYAGIAQDALDRLGGQ